jgi:hypothetical protein
MLGKRIFISRYDWQVYAVWGSFSLCFSAFVGVGMAPKCLNTIQQIPISKVIPATVVEVKTFHAKSSVSNHAVLEFNHGNKRYFLYNERVYDELTQIPNSNSRDLCTFDGSSYGNKVGQLGSVYVDESDPRKTIDGSTTMSAVLQGLAVVLLITAAFMYSGISSLRRALRERRQAGQLL